MKITRRNFMASAPVVAGMVAGLNGFISAQTVTKKGLFPIPDLAGDALSRLSWRSFFPNLYTDFTFSDSKGTSATLRLADMQDLRPLAAMQKIGGQECFAMTFTGPANQLLRQGTYMVDHFALGHFNLFITGSLTQRKKAVYTAIINRVTS